MKKMKRGFTLIELLVVIAIIGILAMIVIANVAKARGKGVNAHVLADMSTAQKTADICMIDQFYLYDMLPSISHGVLWTASFVNMSESSLICSINTTTINGSAPPDAPGKWPAISTYGKGPDSNSWNFQTQPTPQVIITSAPQTFSFYANTGTTNSNFRVDCTQSGCVRKDGTGASTSW